jgi:hypothetical protein
MKVREASQIKRTLALYNSVPNFLWSALNLIPIAVFAYRFIEPKYLYLFIVASLTPVFISNSYLDKLKFAKTRTAYKKMGVEVINKFTQNGAIINAMVRKKFPHYRGVQPNSRSVKKLIGQSYMQEKFHWLMFLFFILVMLYAFYDQHILWALIILITNLFYNVYPILLQQYIRLKLSSVRHRLYNQNIT